MTIAEPEVARVLEIASFELGYDAGRGSGGAILAGLEDVLSNSIRLTERKRLMVDDVIRTLEVLYDQHVADGGRGATPQRIQ